MGELHLDVLVDRMRREFGVEANIGKPQVAYREAIRKKLKWKASLSSSPVVVASTVTAGCVLSRVALMKNTLEFVNEVVGGAIPREYIPAVDKGVQEQMKNGCLAGYPLLAMKVTVFDGSFHDVDSSEMAFKIAGQHGAQERCPELANAALLEPIMKVEVITPEENMGDVVGDLNRRRGMVSGHG
jgi:elongation factor G